MNPEKPPRAPVKVVAKLCQEPRSPAAPKQNPAMTTINTTFNQVSASCTLPDFRVPRIFNPVISQVIAIAKTWLHNSSPIAGCEKKLKMENVPRTLARPAAIVAIDAGLAIVIHVHMYRNATVSPYASRRNAYSPPYFGRIAATSAYVIAPNSDSNPPVIQTT